MPELNFEEIKEKIHSIQSKLGTIDHVVTRYLNPKVYSNGDAEIELTAEQLGVYEKEYLQLRDELEDLVGELPE